MRIALIAHNATRTNRALSQAGWGPDAACLLTPVEADVVLERGDVALARLDVRTTLDGIEPGLLELECLAARGIRMLNGARSLLLAHDKLLTAQALLARGLPHPATEAVGRGTMRVSIEPPLVLKPRFGSWGEDVVLCPTPLAVEATLATFAQRRWIGAGAIAQELVPPRGYDLRLVVAAGRVVGAIRRVAAHGEWRTNVALGASRTAAVPPGSAVRLALDAARATGLDLCGVDLLPVAGGEWTVLEVNGAVEFTHEYRLLGDPFALAAESLHGLLAADHRFVTSS
jgi:beta-citrylglutamate/N-acetylaspartylglutamate synthase